MLDRTNEIGELRTLLCGRETKLNDLGAWRMMPSRAKSPSVPKKNIDPRSAGWVAGRIFRN